MTHSIEIVPLLCTETGLRLRTKFRAATEYDVVARRVSKGQKEFLWRRPADTIEEAQRIADEAKLELGRDTRIVGDMHQLLAAALPTAPRRESAAAG